MENIKMESNIVGIEIEDDGQLAFIIEETEA